MALDDSRNDQRDNLDRLARVEDDSMRVRHPDHPEDCPACLRGHWHSERAHNMALARAYGRGEP